MAQGSTGTDMGIGLTLACSAVALLGAVGMYAAPTQLGRAWGFAGAVLFATFAVAAIQLYS